MAVVLVAERACALIEALADPDPGFGPSVRIAKLVGRSIGRHPSCRAERNAAPAPAGPNSAPHSPVAEGAAGAARRARLDPRLTAASFGAAGQRTRPRQMWKPSMCS